MPKLSRRQMLKLLGAGVAGAALAACRPKATPEPAQKATSTVAKEEKPTPTPVPPPAKTVMVTFVESWFGVPQFTDSVEPVTKAISEKMQGEGLNVEVRSMILDNHEEKYQLLYASGADFTCAFDAPWYRMPGLIDQSGLLAIESLIEEYGPSLVQSIGKEIVDFNYDQGPDGKSHLYGIPVRFYYSGTTGVCLREDLRVKYGAPEPTSAEGYASLEPYLQAIKENEPNMIPFADRPAYPMTSTNGWNWARRGRGFGGVPGLLIPDVFEGAGLVEIEQIEGQVQAWELARRWFEKGYVPQEAIAADYNVLTDYYNVQKTASFQENEPEYKAYEHGKAIAGLVPGAETRGFDLSGVRAGKKGVGNLKQWNFVVFNANAPQEQIVAGMQFFNWLTSNQDNADLWLMGIEGVNYKKEPNLRFSDIAGVDPSRNYRRQWYVSGIGGVFQRQPLDLPKESEEALRFFTTKENWLFTPLEKFDVSTKEIETELAAMQAASGEAGFGLALGSLPTEEAMANYAQMLDAAGRQKVKEWFQAKIDAWVAENKDYIDSFETGL